MTPTADGPCPFPGRGHFIPAPPPGGRAHSVRAPAPWPPGAPRPAGRAPSSSRSRSANVRPSSRVHSPSSSGWAPRTTRDELSPWRLLPIPVRRLPQSGAPDLPHGAWSAPGTEISPAPGQKCPPSPGGWQPACGGLVEDHGPLLPPQGTPGGPGGFLVHGQKPSKVKRPVGWPEAASAVTRAQGPGMGTTGTPAAAHRATISSPGRRWPASPRP